jgi:hypothetical protein
MYSLGLLQNRAKQECPLNLALSCNGEARDALPQGLIVEFRLTALQNGHHRETS